MSDDHKATDALLALLEWTSGDELSDAEVEEELAAAMIDVPALLSRAHKRTEQLRLAWRDVARAKIAAAETTIATGRYARLGRDALLAQLAERHGRTAAAGQAFFHKYEDHTDDDLRTHLEDQDALDEDE